MKIFGILAALALAVTLMASPAAHAQSSCWNHNGSVMRVTFSGSNIRIVYQRPRQVLRRAGVRRGTLLLDARERGGVYRGTARRFSRFCPQSPLPYSVSGQLIGDYSLEFEGYRPVHNRCRATGRTEYDELFFDYIGPC
ncbi:MAG: hypothetical protein AAF318_07995 [Pseudomonadota bacterium]